MGSVINSERLPNIAHVGIGTQNATITLPALYVRKHSRIKEIRIADQLGIAADNTNYMTFVLQDASATSYASYDTRAAHEGALVANVSKKMTLTSPVGDTTNQPEVDVPAGTELSLVVTAHATVTTTLARVQIEMYPL